MKNENVLTAGQAADLLGIKVQTLWSWTNVGVIKAIQRPGYKHRLYSRNEIENFWRRHEDFSPTAKVLKKIKSGIRRSK